MLLYDNMTLPSIKACTPDKASGNGSESYIMLFQDRYFVGI